MKTKYLLFYLLFILVIGIFNFKEVDQLNHTILSSKKALSNQEITDLIDYFDSKKTLTPNFLQVSDRGMGCEAMKKCSIRGTCQNGSCVCDEGYDYFDCSVNIQKCPNNCYYHGECINGKCVCDIGWYGYDCSNKACPDDCSGHGQCIVRNLLNI